MCLSVLCLIEHPWDLAEENNLDISDCLGTALLIYRGLSVKISTHFDLCYKCMPSGALMKDKTSTITLH